MTLSTSLALSAAALFTILSIQKRAGARVSGLFAGLPLTTAPCALIVFADQGALIAAQTLSGAMVASSAACFGLMTFAFLRAYVGRIMGSFITMAVFAAVCALALLAAGESIHLRTGVACALFAVALGMSRLLPLPHIVGTLRGCPIAITFPLALGAVSLAAVLCRALPATWGGVLAAAPILGLAAILVNHFNFGYDAVAHAAKGYVTGVASKLVFCAVLMYGLVFGLGLWLAFAIALGLAGLAAATLNVMQTKLALPAAQISLKSHAFAKT